MNGAFYENPKTIVVSDREIAFLTVLPLSASVLPYTVKLSGKKIFNNTDLTSLVKIADGKYLLRLFPRYNYVYSPSPSPSNNASSGLVPHFFNAIAKRDLNLARTYLTPSLSSTVSDDALIEFFSPYKDAIDGNGIGNWDDNVYLLVGENDETTPFRFTIKTGLIDDICQV